MRTSNQRCNGWRKPSRGTTRDSGFIPIRGRRRYGPGAAVGSPKRRLVCPVLLPASASPGDQIPSVIPPRRLNDLASPTRCIRPLTGYTEAGKAFIPQNCSLASEYHFTLGGPFARPSASNPDSRSAQFGFVCSNPAAGRMGSFFQARSAASRCWISPQIGFVRSVLPNSQPMSRSLETPSPGIWVCSFKTERGSGRNFGFVCSKSCCRLLGSFFQPTPQPATVEFLYKSALIALFC
jgi:hypothetical protein